ncbi:putative RING-H2 finger protein ATL19 [Raphanus sativus]|uniref:RING-type E3 ubiquitin transferase n=1 Tax=Raphanus sativus TaxID=3726 RepID=A0A6J0NYK8_RAPSA|nr:putative RING-H2 finger protein ATL19 [Raphanus sativus]KAJ4917881.1 putative RING-H2 finger protein ATL19 [Raphanus sativus]
MMNSEEDVVSFITVLGLAVFIGLCFLLIVLIATSAIILVIYVIIDCILRPFLGTCLDLDLEIGVQRGQQRARIVTYHAIIPTDLHLPYSERQEKRKRGLKQSEIETLLPKWRVGQGNNHEEDEERSRDCAICLSGYVVNEECRVFPVCRHMYHAACIDAWLKNHLTCPTCRNDLPDS